MGDAINVMRTIKSQNVSSLEAGKDQTLGTEDLRRIDPYWRAANYLSVGQIYLHDNPLLREPLTMAHAKPLVVSHRGKTPGQNFIYAHLNRSIKNHDLDIHLVQDVVDRVPGLGSKGASLKQHMRDKLIEHKQYIDQHGGDPPETRNWKWGEST